MLNFGGYVLREEVNEKWMLISKLNKEFDELYHKISVHYNLSDSSFWILYTLYENKQGYTQKEICSDWYFSKQTINSSIKDLENKKYIELKYENNNKKNKKICLTELGLEIAKNTVKKVIEAENRAFSKINKKELDKVINFFQVQLDSLKEEMNKII